MGREEFEFVLDELLARLTLSAIEHHNGTRCGAPVSGTAHGRARGRGGPPSASTADGDDQLFPLAEETDTMRWMHDEVRVTRLLPLAEAEAVVRSLSVAMHSGRQLMIPLLQLEEFDQYTTTHSLERLPVLAMALSEFLGVGPKDTRTLGIRGLLHDLGKIRIPSGNNPHQERGGHRAGAPGHEPAPFR